MPVPLGGCWSGVKNVEEFTFTLRTRTVCSLSSNAKLESTTSEMPVTGKAPTSASACA